jgi:integrase
MRGTGWPSAKYVSEELGQLRMALQEMRAEAMPASELTEAQIRALLGSAVGTTTARHRFGPLSRFLDWCQDAGHIAANPCTLIARSRRPRAPQARSHYLTPAQLGRLWDAVKRLGEPVWRDLTRFLIAVPCRRSEAARLDWSHIDLNAAQWRQPGQLTKNRDSHRIHLHRLAHAILTARHDAAGKPNAGLVFPAPASGKPVDTFSDMKERLTEAAGLDHWTWHDFRRSFATALGEAGIAEVVADAVLNHRQSATRGGVLGVYQRGSRWPDQKRAMELWGQLLDAAIEGRDADANVVQISAWPR